MQPKDPADDVTQQQVAGDKSELDIAAEKLREIDEPKNDGLTRLAEQVVQTEKLVHQLIANSDNSIQVLTTDGRVLSVNLGGRRRMGVADQDEVLGEPWVEWWDAQHRIGVEEALDRARREGSSRFIASTRTTGGEVRWWDSIITLMTGDGQQPEHLIANSRDITALKAAESALSEKEQNHRLVVESIKEYAIFTLDPNGVVTSWNSGAARIFHYQPSEIIGRDGEILWTEEDQATGGAALEMEEARRNGWAKDERWHRRQDGSRFFATGALNSIYDAEGNVSGFTKICRDVTQQRDAEKEIALVRTRLDAALIAGEIGTWVWEVESDRVFADANLARLFSMSPEDAAGGPVGAYLEVIDPEDRDRVASIIAEAVKNGSEYEADYRIRSGAGVRWVTARGRIERDDSGKAVRLAGVVLDVTERKLAQSDLQTVQERFGLAIEAAELGTFYCPLPFGEIIWNEKTKEHFWLPHDARVNIDLFFSILHPDDVERVKAALDHAINDRALYNIEYRTISPAGEIRWVKAMGKCFYDASGNPLRFDGITIDISDAKMSEEDREDALAAERSAREEAERSGRLKDDFLATLSHELRTPLNAILGWAQVLRSPKRTAEDIDQGLDTIERNARAQTQIIEDLLEMSRIISGKIRLDVQRVNLGSVIEAAIGTVHPTADVKGIKIRSILDPSISAMNGDPNRLQQVFWNLLANAIKFTPRHGTVEVAMQKVGSHIEVSITDSGEGISGEFLPHVFDRFRQADGSSTRQHGGLGLGLAIVKQLVEVHGGTVRAESPGAGQGSTFTVSLPQGVLQYVAEPQPAAQRHPSATSAPLHTLTASLRLDGLKVVVIDDEPEARLLVARLLEDCGAQVSIATTVDETLAAVERERPDVLVSDIGMPGEDGYSLIKKVRALPHDRGGLTPAIALTAYARAEDRMKAILAGFQMHLSKPVDGSELLAVVASVTGRNRG